MDIMTYRKEFCRLKLSSCCENLYKILLNWHNLTAKVYKCQNIHKFLHRHLYNNIFQLETPLCAQRDDQVKYFTCGTFAKCKIFLSNFPFPALLTMV